MSLEALATFETMTPSFPKLEESSAASIGRLMRDMIQVHKEIEDPAEGFDFEKALVCFHSPKVWGGEHYEHIVMCT